MDFTLPCECGESVMVSEGLAGATQSCRCGRNIKVPSLKELRTLAGLSAVPVAPEDEVLALLETGGLPGKKCLHCGKTADQAIPLESHCESQHQRGINPDGWVAAFLRGFAVSHWTAIPLLQSSQRRFEVFGRETIVPVPLALCESCAPLIEENSAAYIWAFRLLALAALPLLAVDFRLSATSAALAVIALLVGSSVRSGANQRIRTLMNRIPAYSALLQKFPTAVIARTSRANSAREPLGM